MSGAETKETKSLEVLRRMALEAIIRSRAAEGCRIVTDITTGKITTWIGGRPESFGEADGGPAAGGIASELAREIAIQRRLLWISKPPKSEEAEGALEVQPLRHPVPAAALLPTAAQPEFKLAGVRDAAAPTPADSEMADVSVTAAAPTASQNKG